MDESSDGRTAVEGGAVPERLVLRALAAAVPHRVWWEDAGGRVLGCNQALAKAIGLNAVSDVVGRRLVELPGAVELVCGDFVERTLTTPLGDEGDEAQVWLKILPPDDRDPDGTLAAVGRLALGVAHDLNTPLQFVSDNITFLADSVEDIFGVLDDLTDLAQRHDAPGAEAITSSTDFDFLREEVPDAVAQTNEGLAQMRQLVRGLRDFSMEGSDYGEVDLNDLVSRAVMVSGNEWRYRAELDLFLDPDLPALHGAAGELKQTVVTLIMQAVGSIAQVVSDGELGTISIATFRRGDRAGLSVADNGAGLEPEERARLFDEPVPGQPVTGLSSAAAVVAAHGGAIEVDSAVGSGTTFYLDFPIDSTPRPQAAGTTGASS